MRLGGFHFDAQEVVERRNHDLLRILENLLVAYHRGAQKDVRDMLLLDVKLH